MIDPNKVILDGEQSDAIIGAQAAEIRRLRLTDEEREAIQRAIDSQQRIAAEMHSRSWNAAAIDDDCDTLFGLLERTK
jgi:hypothetical protein